MAVQTAVNELDQTIIQHKTATRVVSSATSTVAVPLDIDGDPAQIIVTLRQDDTPTPYQNFCVHVAKFNGKYNAVICMGPSAGSSTVSVPAGTYRVDYIVIA